jgi:nucleotide-binding universal stress UspA family protein
VRRAYELANPEKDKVCVVAVLEKRRDRKINMGKMGKMFQKQNTAGREERMEPDPRLYEKRKQVEQMLSFVTTGMPQAQAFKGRVSYRVEEGDPRELIIFAAIAENADYIVVGEKGDGDVKHQRIGATTDYLVRHAPCSVVVVKTLCEE